MLSSSNNEMRGAEQPVITQVTYHPLDNKRRGATNA